MTRTRRDLLASVVVSGSLAGCIGTLYGSPNGNSGNEKTVEAPVARSVSLVNSREPITRNAPGLDSETQFFGTIFTNRNHLDQLRETATFNPEKYRNFDFDGRFISLNAAALPYNRELTSAESTVTDETFRFEGHVARQPDNSAERRLYNVVMEWDVDGEPLPNRYEMHVDGLDGEPIHSSHGSV